MMKKLLAWWPRKKKSNPGPIKTEYEKHREEDHRDLADVLTKHTVLRARLEDRRKTNG